MGDHDKLEGEIERTWDEPQVNTGWWDSIKRHRRYQLLQAAVILYAGGQHTAESAVTEAEALLAEIERRIP